MTENSFYAIGDPGRAALEIPLGPPPIRVGRPDVEHSAASLPGMLALGATFRGLQHRARGVPCQDAFAIAHRTEPGKEQRLIAVVCDGVGSLSRSDEAAVLVSRRLAVLGADGLPWPDAFIRANEELRKFATETLGVNADIAVGDNGMATTAVAVIVYRETDEWVGEAAWVGDSTLWHLSREGLWTLITGPRHEGSDAYYHSSTVSALPSVDGACTWCGFRLSGGALFVMTDGVANPLQWSRDVQEALATWWKHPPNPFTFAAQVGFARKSHVDDRTVIGIWADGSDVDEGRESEPQATDLPS